MHAGFFLTLAANSSLTGFIILHYSQQARSLCHMLSSPAKANHVPMLAAHQSWVKHAPFCLLFVLKELETGASGQALLSVLSHNFAHPQQPKGQLSWKIKDPGMVCTCGSCGNLPWYGAGAVWDRSRVWNLSGAMGSEFNLEHSFWDDFVPCLARTMQYFRD